MSMTPIDELLQKCHKNLIEGRIEFAPKYVPRDTPCAVTELCNELNAALDMGEATITKTVVKESYEMVLTPQECEDLRVSIGRQLGYIK